VTAQIIDLATRKTTIIGQIANPNPAIRQPYHIHVVPTDKGFEWWVCTEDPDAESEPDEDDVAADLASIALQLRPPPRTFFERLKALFLGDEQ